MTDEERINEWHLDRRFSVALILMLLCQIATAVWFASKTDSRIGALEARYLEVMEIAAKNRNFHIEQRLRVWDRLNAQGEALNDVRSNLAAINAQLDYISRSLDRLTLLRDRVRRPETSGE